MVPDPQLRQDVGKELSWDASNVTVTAMNGAVTLSASVRNYYAKYEAERIAKRVCVHGRAADRQQYCFRPAHLHSCRSFGSAH
jgi:BON domain